MPFSIKKRVDDGANAVLYRGDDGLGREVAIKLINESSAYSNFILDQAKSLAKFDSPHVVEVIVIQEFDDPEKPGTRRDGIVMEWLDGKTVLDITRGPLISTDEAKRIGIGMIDGLVAIHQSGLAHTDLHSKNVMVGTDFVKILDIQYHDSLSGDTAAGKEAKLKRDRDSIADLIRQVLHKAQTPADRVTAFNVAISDDDSLDGIRKAFEAATGATDAADLQQQVEKIYGKFTNAKFVGTQEYATILADATPDSVIRPLIEMILANGSADNARRKYLRAIWSRLAPHDRTSIGAHLGEALDDNIPTGSPVPHLNMLTAFGESGWNSLPPINRVPIEKALLDDMRQGRRNAYYGFGAGHLGTWCMNFYPYFSDRKRMLDNVLHLLRVRWDGQNYVGECFMHVLDDLAENDKQREELTKAIVGAMEDDAYRVKQHINKLPEMWRTEIQSRVELSQQAKDPTAQQEPASATEVVPAEDHADAAQSPAYIENTATAAKPSSTMERANKELGWGLEPSELAVSRGEVNEFLQKLEKLPEAQRGFLMSCVRRAKAASHHSGRQEVLCQEIESALHLQSRDLVQQVDVLRAHGLGFIDTDPYGTKIYVEPGHAAWDVFGFFKEFCSKTGTDLKTILVDLDFTVFD